MPLLQRLLPATAFVVFQLAQWSLLLLVGLLTVLVVLPAFALVRLAVHLIALVKKSAASPSPSPSPLPRPPKPPTSIAFFHPYCNAGGGGERVLWCAIQAVQRWSEASSSSASSVSTSSTPAVQCVVFTGDVDAGSGEAILSKARSSFGFSESQLSSSKIRFVFLHSRAWVEAARYPFLTLLGQSLGSLVLGYEALFQALWLADGAPSVFLDTMGFAFILPLFRVVAGCKVGCYVHYPTISTDMLEMVKSRASTYNNSSSVSQSRVLSLAKLLYYKLFAWLYGCAGLFSQLVLVNSSWTHGHISRLWSRSRDAVYIGNTILSELKDDGNQAQRAPGASRTLQLASFTPSRIAQLVEPLSPNTAIVLYPPCNTSSLCAFPLSPRPQNPALIVSVAQFRPEKAHALQVRSLAAVFQKKPLLKGRLKLALIGSCRHAEDEARVDDLKRLCDSLDVSDNVEFHVNSPHSVLRDYLSKSTIGIHTMWNEHFGIGVAEYMAAGAIPIAHKSGGPLMDIVTPYNGESTGFLASTEAEYADAIADALALDDRAKLRMQERARESVSVRFSDEIFGLGFYAAVHWLISRD